MWCNFANVLAVALFGAPALQTGGAIEGTSQQISALRATDTASTLVLLGITLAGLGAVRRFRPRK